MRTLRLLILAAAALSLAPALAHGQSAQRELCPRPAAGSTVAEPKDLRSEKGVLKVELTYESFRDALGHIHYCYRDRDGNEAPNLRLAPGDWLALTLRNDLKPSAPSPAVPVHEMAMTMPMADSCGGGAMDAVATNLHFHGLSVPPVCHQDDVLHTLIGPGDPPFEYRFQIPPDEPPGLYWYHPHVHGFSSAQVLGGASGALIIEGIERENRQLAGLPERVLIIRDQELLHPDAEPSQSGARAPTVLRDAEGDILNTGMDGGKPAKDLSVNFVPVAYPDFPPAVLAMKPSERQLWRVLNASTITYLDLDVLLGGMAQPLGVVSLDGAPINENGRAEDRIDWRNHVALPPGGRAEFVVQGPPEGARATLRTRVVDTGPAGENDPTRPLATILAQGGAPEPRAALSTSPMPRVARASAWLGEAKPVRQRKLYFSEAPSDPNDPNSPTAFFITVDGEKPAVYDPHATAPNIVVHQGNVEDWIIENRSRELHAFHIHQIHFVLKEWNGVPVEEPFLRDTVNVPYWNGMSAYPQVKLRMDFRDPNIVGTFVYHCHLLEHEDGGMMGTIRVDPAPKAH